MTEQELRYTLDLHRTWLYDKDNLKGKRANLLDSVLSEKDLGGAELTSATLTASNLSYAKLHWANLKHTELNNANLNHAYLCHADLSYANLAGANLIGAHLGNADLTGTDLSNANLAGASLHDAKGSLIEYRKGKILTEDIIGYKKCRKGIIVTLRIPRGAIIFSINGYKCRTNKAEVIAIEGATRAISNYKYMSYYVGDKFTVYDFNCEYNVECATGIHFFMNKDQAKRY